jgi:hypothetical protein
LWYAWSNRNIKTFFHEVDDFVRDTDICSSAMRREKRTPRCSSRRLIDRLTAAGVRPRLSAALLKPPVFAALQLAQCFPAEESSSRSYC